MMAALCVCGTMTAETRVDKPRRGSFAAEVQFNPFNQTDNTTLGGIERVKVRWFISNSNALRLRLGFGYDSEKYFPDKEQNSERWFKGSRGDFNFDLGWEHRWNVARRVDLYAGLQAGILRHFASAKSNTFDGQYTKVTNAIPKDMGILTDHPHLDNSTSFTDRARFGYTFGTFAGIDVYLYRGLYVGTELALDVSNEKTLKAEMKTTFNNGTGTNDNGHTTDQDRTFSSKLRVQPGIRLGWTF